MAEGAIVTVQKDDFLKTTVQNKKLLFLQALPPEEEIRQPADADPPWVRVCLARQVRGQREGLAPNQLCN